jgi:hypothetical protein
MPSTARSISRECESSSSEEPNSRTAFTSDSRAHLAMVSHISAERIIPPLSPALVMNSVGRVLYPYFALHYLPLLTDIPEKQRVVTFQSRAPYCRQGIKGRGNDRPCLFRLLGGGFHMIDNGGEKGVAVALGLGANSEMVINIPVPQSLQCGFLPQPQTCMHVLKYPLSARVKS